MRKSLLLFAMVVLIFFGLRWTSAPFFSIKEYHCVQVGCLSDDYFSLIKTRVGQLLYDAYNANALITHLKKEFPLLNKIIVAYRPCGVYVMMYAYKPVCCINNEFILADNNELFSKNSFVINDIDSIAHITVAQECLSQVPVFVSSLLRELPSDFNKTYDLELINQHCVHLIDKKDQDFTIISSVAQQNMPILLSQCALVKKNIDERNGFDKGIKWIADIRFADYIVAYKA